LRLPKSTSQELPLPPPLINPKLPLVPSFIALRYDRFVSIFDNYSFSRRFPVGDRRHFYALSLVFSYLFVSKEGIPCSPSLWLQTLSTNSASRWFPPFFPGHACFPMSAPSSGGPLCPYPPSVFPLDAFSWVNLRRLLYPNTPLRFHRCTCCASDALSPCASPRSCFSPVPKSVPLLLAAIAISLQVDRG